MKRFEIGKTYSCRSICDYDCIFSFVVMKRTEKCVWIKHHDRITRRTIRVSDTNVEEIDPLGRYSMSPILRAA